MSEVSFSIGEVDADLRERPDEEISAFNTAVTGHPDGRVLSIAVRIARPTDQLEEIVSFYSEGLGLPELDRFAGHAGYRGVLLGLPGMAYHLEFTQHDRGSPGPAPSRDNLLALYFDDRAQVDKVATRLAGLGHLPVEAENPYWTEHGAVTVEDPDHWRVVLMPQPSA